MKAQEYVVFIRGINVGGHAIVGMNDLKNALRMEGFSGAETYINSGNIIIESARQKDEIAEIISQILKNRFEVDAGTLIKTSQELDLILKADPYDRYTEIENSKKIVMMLSGIIDPDEMAKLKNRIKLEENYYLFSDVIYVYYHKGSGRSRFTTNLIEKKFRVTATARNWNTLLKMTQIWKHA